MDLMRILQVISQLADFMGDSGQVLLLAKNFQKKGHQVSIVTTDGDPFFNNKQNSMQYEKTRIKLQESKGKVIEIDGIPVYAVHCVLPKFGMFSPGAYSFAKKNCQKL